MSALFFANALLGALPVLTFLAALEHFDTFKLVRGRAIFQAIAAGAGAAGVAWLINNALLERMAVDFTAYTHLASPAVEEGLKALLIIALIRTNRIGFMFDAVILGFAIGAGFALVENFYYLKTLGLEHPAVWVIRGFGTAIMHGGVAAIFAAAGHFLTLRDDRARLLHFAPGFMLAITLHSGFNFFLDFPVSSTIAMMTLLALALSIAMTRDRSSIHDWIAIDFDHHRKLIEAIDAKRYGEFKLGRLLEEMHVRADDTVATDVIAYIRTHTGLILKAEGVLLAHERGEKPAIDDATRAELHRLKDLEERIGKAALMVLGAHLKFNRHEFWELYMLEKEAGFKHPHVHGV